MIRLDEWFVIVNRWSMRLVRSLPLPLLVGCLVVGCGSSSDSGDDDDGGGATSDGGTGGAGSHADGSTDATAAGGGSGDDASTGGGGGGGGSDAGSGGGGDAGGTRGDSGPGTDGGTPPQQTVNGNPAGKCAVPTGAGPEDVSSPTTVVGTGTAASCTATAFASAVKAGGVVTFNCGADPITLVVPQISIVNNGGKTSDGSVTIDGGNKITLSGNHQNQILHQDTCDSTLVYTSSHCQDQPTPHLVVQNIAFTAGKVAGSRTDGAQFGGGALYVSGGTFKAYNVSVTDSQQTTLDQDVAGGAIYTFNQATQPVTIVQSTFDGNSGASGGALGSIGTSWTLVNDLFTGNAATGNGENPKQPGTPGGGLGGAVYNDGDGYTLTSCGTLFSTNTAPDLGSGAIFQVVDDLKGKLVLNQSTFSGNSNTDAVQGSVHPQIYVEAADKTGMSGVTISSDTVFE